MLQLFKNITTAAIILFLSISLAGCLKDKNYDNGAIQSIHNNGMEQNTIEIQLTATSSDNFLQQSLDNANVDTVINSIPVVLSSPGVATEDIRVTLTLNPTLVANYNAANGSSLVVPAAGLYTVMNPGKVVIIPKGERVGYLKLKLKPSDFLGQTWALGFSLSTIETAGYHISGNLNNGIFAFGIKNKYEAMYHSTGYFQHPSSPRSINRDKYLSTVDANSVSFELGDLGAATQVTVTINADNTLGLVPGPGANPATALIPGDPVYNNTYDPATKTFYLKYGYPNPATRIITEAIKRL